MLRMALAPYALSDSDTQGRRYAEPPHPYRSAFQRDRDRVIHTKAFRRLEKKTQVFAPDLSDHFRTRLTHTLEVAQITRTIGQGLGLNSDLCEALALSHDIGHPPFSHEGEKALDSAMGRHGEGFEHNLHALTIVEDFECKYASFRGLNLTFEVREGIIKHSRDYDQAAPSYIDVSEYRLKERPPLEAQIIDWADEIAYNTADLDDGYTSGLLTLDCLQRESALFRRLHGETLDRFPQAEEGLQVSETIRSLIDFLVTALIEQTRSRLDNHGIDNLEKVRRHPTRLAGFDPETAGENRGIKSLLRNRLYDHPLLLQSRRKAGAMVLELFDFYMGSPERLPAAHRGRLKQIELHRVVCNYIAGMTDSYAKMIHNNVAFGQC